MDVARGARPLALAMALATLAPVAGAADASSGARTVQAVGEASTTTYVVSPASPLPGTLTSLTATVSTAHLATSNNPTGTVDFVESPGPSETILGSIGLAPAAIDTATATLALAGGFTVGDHVIEARYLGDAERAPSSSGPSTVSVDKAPTFVSLVGPGAIQTHHAFQLTASIGSPIGGWADGTTMTFTRTGSGTPACVVPVTTSNEMICTVASLPIGAHSYTATYSGNATIAGSTSAPAPIDVTADTLDASGVGRNYSTFYPVKDSYRDTLSIFGRRLEAISVSIRIYSPTGSLVKRGSISRGSGLYRFTWTGRNSAGSILAGGRYRIVQTLTDAAGTAKSFTSYVTLSRKRLVTKTTYVTKNGSSITAKGDPGSGRVVISTSGGYAKLTGVYPGGWVGVGYQFSLPSAVVYKSIAFQIYTKAPFFSAPNKLGLQNFAWCPYAPSTSWSMACFDHWQSVGNEIGTTSWMSAAGSPTNNRSGRIVRGAVSIDGGTVYVYKARVRVVYGVLQ
jgi:hypothetical protein